MKKSNVARREDLQISDNLRSRWRIDTARTGWQNAAAISIFESDRPHPEWQSRTWTFVRLCKTQFPHLTAEEAFDRIPWDDLEDFDEEDHIQFMSEWYSVRHIDGVEPLAWAWEMAKKMPLNPPPASPGVRFRSYGTFLSVAGWLQVLRGKEPIFLPTRRVGDLLGLSHTTIENLCKFAVKDGLLEIVEEHTEQRSTRYRFAVTRYSGPIQEWVTAIK